MSSRWSGRPDGRQGGPREGRGGLPNAAPGGGSAEAAVHAPVLTVDALGRKCPIPIIMLAERIHEVPVGAVVAVLADDPAARTDIPSWCGMKSHEFVTARTLQRGWAILVRRCY